MAEAAIGMRSRCLAWMLVGLVAIGLYGPWEPVPLSAQTRFYLPSSSATTIAPSLTSIWSHTQEVALRRYTMNVQSTSTAQTDAAYAPDAADHLTSGSSLFVQFYSNSSLAAQTIASQVVKMQFQVNEDHAGNNLGLSARLFVVSGGGTTVKETLMTQVKALTEVNTALTNRTLFATSTSATVETGDRLVFEVGLAGLPTAAGQVQGHNGTVRVGDPDGATDLPEDDTTTGNGFRPWIEFANTLEFESVESDTSCDNGFFVCDTFTDTADTTLASHTGETGATWTAHPSSAVTSNITDANRLRMTASEDTGGSDYYASGSPASADYEVEGVLYVKSVINESGVLGRVDSTTTTWYEAMYLAPSTEWRLLSRVNGTPTTNLGTFTQVLSTETAYTVTLRMVGSAISLWVDGVERVSATNTDVTAAGKAGIRYWGTGTPSNTAGLHLDSITATDVVSGAGGSRLVLTGAGR